MTVDVATLGIAVTSNADKAAIDLDRLTASGKKAEEGAKATSSASSSLASALNQAVSALRENTAASQANTSALSGNASAAKTAASAENALAAAHDKGASAASRKAKEADDLAMAEERLAAAERSAASASATLGDAIGQASGRMNALKASADPIGFAIDKVNSELIENEALLRSGSLSQSQYIQNQLVLTNRLEDLTRKQQAYNATLGASGRAVKLSTQEALNLSRQVADIGVTAAMGMNPIMIAIQQGPQIADIMKTSGIGIGGIAKEMAIMLGLLKVVNVEQTAQIAITTADTAATITNTAAKSANVAANAAVAATSSAEAETEVAASAAKVAGAAASQVAVVANTELAASNGALAASSGTAMSAAAEMGAAVTAQAAAENAAAIAAIRLAAGNEAVAVSASSAAAAENALATATGRAAGAAGGATAAAGVQVAANGAIAASATAAGAASTAAGAATAVALAPAALVIGAVVVALGVLTAAWGLATRAANKEIGDNIDHLKLSEAQLERLKEQGTDTGITMGDTFLGLGTTIKEMFFEQFGDQIDWLGDKWSQGMDWLSTTGIKAVKVIGGGFNGAFYAIREVFMSLPAVLSDIFVTAANGVIEIVEGLVNKVISHIERIGSIVNKGAELVGLGPIFGESNFGGIGRIENPNAGAAGNVGQQASAAFGRGYENYGSAVDSFGEAFERNTSASRDARVAEAAGDPDKARKSRRSGLSDEERELQRATKAAEEYIEGMREETAQIGMNTIERHRYAVAIAEAAAPTEELKRQIREVGKAWEDATIAERQSNLVKSLEAANDEIAHETRLQGMNALEREVANAQREVSIRLAELEADGIPTSTAAIQEQTDALIKNAEARGQLKLNAEEAYEFADAMAAIADRINDASSGMTGFAGVLGEIVGQYADYQSEIYDSLARVAEVEAQYGEQSVEANRERARSAQELAQAQVNAYGSMLSSAKGFFAENSTGYKVLQAAEQAYRLYQFAMSVKAMFFDTAETTTAAANASVRMGVDAAETSSSVAKSGIRAAADGVAAFAKTLASLPFPFNLAAGAVVLAALVGVGVAMSGKGGGKGASTSATPVEETPTTYTPFVSHDRPASSSIGFANDNRVSPPEPNRFVGNMGGDRKTVFDFSNANFSGSDPQAVQEAIRRGIQEAAPEILEEARTQTYQDLQTLNRQKLGG